MLISMILVLLVGVLAVNAVSLRSRNAQYKKQEAELEAQIKEEKKRAFSKKRTLFLCYRWARARLRLSRA